MACSTSLTEGMVGASRRLGMTWALAYHMLNGIRHLIWDMGYGFEMETVERSGIAVVIGSGVLTALLWLVA